MQTQFIGDIRIDRLVESDGPFADADFLLPDIDPSLLEQHKNWLYPRFVEPVSNKIIMSFHSLIIRSPRATILVDTCVGNDKERPSRKGWHRQKTPWLEKLGKLGLQSEDIDYVLCTHLHADHVGWNTQLIDERWVPTFPNARYVFGKEEYQYWQLSNESHTGDMPLNHGCFYDSVLPVVEAGQTVLVDNDHQLDQGIWLEPAPGHTPGNVIVHVKAGEQHAILSGDVMHSAVQLANPDLSSRFCLDPDLSCRSRKQLIEAYADTSVIMLPAHFPTPTAGRIIGRGSSFAYDCCQ
ncbi:MAG: MBL fold metallo-hydrolase [Granulosicoccus sp.]